MKKLFIFLLSLMFVLAGCSNVIETQKIATAGSNQQEESNEHFHEESKGHSGHKNDEHHRGSNLTIDFHVHKLAKVNEETMLSAHVQNEHQALKNATVRLEIWKKNEEKHEYINATEEKEGVYTVHKTFSASGSYKIRIHVEKGDEIHDHTESALEVK
ncbi:FixH family protein [Peribacillus sp. SCS-155]|uniref:FixH family protein n=1 Tax=Peribacillus sedimenti TaxID=3115297 RepID=UPI003905DC24